MAHAWSLDAAGAGRAVDSSAWQAHFEDWVERSLVKEQLDQVALSEPEFDRARAIRTLNTLVKDRLDAQPEPMLLPAEVIAGIRAPAIEGPVLQAGRLYGRGEVEEALALLSAPELEADADAAHLRAQIRDVQTQGTAVDYQPFQRLEVISDYRFALSLAGGSAQEDRTRVRIGQILAELGFFPEARATLRPLLKRELRAPYDVAARVSFAETAYLDDDPKSAVEAILVLDLNSLSPTLRLWAIRRTADSLYKLNENGQAVRAYTRLLQEHEQPAIAESAHAAAPTLDPIVRLRLAAALLEVNKPKEAVLELDPLLRDKAASPQLLALAGLLEARGLREAEQLVGALASVRAAAERFPDGEETALAAVEALESQRLAGSQKPELLPAALKLLGRGQEAPGFALLAYRIAADPPDGSGPKAIREKLGRLLRELPDGPVRELVRSDLTTRMQSHLRRVYRDEEELDPQVLEDVVEYLRPTQMDQDALLLALEAFYRRGDWENCKRWGGALYRSEARPIRKGLGAWREVGCRNAKEPAMVSSQGLLLYAQTGKSGPFALPLAALAAERLVRQDNLKAAIEIYDTAIEAIAEPRLLGPTLLRAGELNVLDGRVAIGTRHLLRGLSRTDEKALADDPFRKAGLIALGLAALHPEQRERHEIARMLEAERSRAEEWWQPVYAYLVFRAEQTDPPDGADLFSRAALETSEIKALEERVRDTVGDEALAAARDKGAEP